MKKRKTKQPHERRDYAATINKSKLPTENSDKLNHRQKRFIEEYLKTPNEPVQAYYRAGYKAKNDVIASAGVWGLLKNPKIGQEIRRREALIRKKTLITKEFLIENLVLNLRRSLQQEEVLDAAGNFTGEYRYAGAVANKAIELLGKLIGEFSSLKVEHDHHGEITTTHNLKLSDLCLPADTLRTLLDAARKKAMIADGRPNPPTGNS